MNINSTIESLHTNDNFKSELYHRLSGITIFFFWLRLYRGPTCAENILVGADVTASAGMPRNPTNRKPGIYLDMAGPGVAMRLRPPKCLVVQTRFLYQKKRMRMDETSGIPNAQCAIPERRLESVHTMLPVPFLL